MSSLFCVLDSKVFIALFTINLQINWKVGKMVDGRWMNEVEGLLVRLRLKLRLREERWKMEVELKTDS